MSVKRENNLTKANLHTWRTATLSGNIFGKVEKIDRARERERDFNMQSKQNILYILIILKNVEHVQLCSSMSNGFVAHMQ